jgi:hypothetical protein
MEPTFEPLNDYPPEPVKDYLEIEGFPREIAQWKFFDEQYNRGRSRGFIMRVADRVCGFLGFTPFTMRRQDHTWDCYWSHDWYKAKDSPKGIGRVLLQEATNFAGLHIGYGGNMITRTLYPRYAALTVTDAAIIWRLPLRLGVVLKKISRRVPLLRRHRWPLLGRIAVSKPRSSRLPVETRTEPGVARAIAPLVETARGPLLSPLYDFEYVDWLVGRCPTTVAGTCYIPGDPAPPAAAVFWHPRHDRTLWRAAALSSEDALEHRAAVLEEAINQAYRNGGELITVIASPLETEWVQVLKDRGFMRHPDGIPLNYLQAEGDQHPVEELTYLSWLDSDLGPRY